jgi:hypothetical protein
LFTEIEIDFISGAGGECTLGFNATSSGSAAFVTASHCTRTQGGVEGTGYSQPLVGSRQIGTEAKDPNWFTNAQVPRCPRSTTTTPIYCRWADAAVATYSSGISHERGYLARTTYSSTFRGDSGSYVVDQASPRFRITQGLYGTTAGDPVDKVGWRSGWTWGDVDAPCQDVDLATFSRPGYWLLCQDYAWYGAERGDSGAPVFAYLSSTEAGLQGIHWGALSGGRKLYSPLGGIERDLGTLGYFP